MCIKFLTCRSVDSVEVLRADPAVVCYTAGHTVAMVTALIVLVLTGVIVPLTVSFFNVLSVYGDGDGEDPDSEPELCKYQPPMPAEPATGGKRFESRNRRWHGRLKATVPTSVIATQNVNLKENVTVSERLEGLGGAANASMSRQRRRSMVPPLCDLLYGRIVRKLLNSLALATASGSGITRSGNHHQGTPARDCTTSPGPSMFNLHRTTVPVAGHPGAAAPPSASGSVQPERSDSEHRDSTASGAASGNEAVKPWSQTRRAPSPLPFVAGLISYSPSESLSPRASCSSSVRPQLEVAYDSDLKVIGNSGSFKLNSNLKPADSDSASESDLATEPELEATGMCRFCESELDSTAVRQCGCIREFQQRRASSSARPSHIISNGNVTGTAGIGNFKSARQLEDNSQRHGTGSDVLRNCQWGLPVGTPGPPLQVHPIESKRSRRETLLKTSSFLALLRDLGKRGPLKDAGSEVRRLSCQWWLPVSHRTNVRTLKGTLRR